MASPVIKLSDGKSRTTLIMSAMALLLNRKLFGRSLSSSKALSNEITKSFISDALPSNTFLGSSCVLGRVDWFRKH